MEDTLNRIEVEVRVRTAGVGPVRVISAVSLIERDDDEHRQARRVAEDNARARVRREALAGNAAKMRVSRTTVLENTDWMLPKT